MYFLELHYENAKHGERGRFIIRPQKGAIPKWSVVNTTEGAHQLLQMIALAATGTNFLSGVPYSFHKITTDPDVPLRLEFAIARHWNAGHCTAWFGNGVAIMPDGGVKRLSRKDFRHLTADIPKGTITNSKNLSRNVLIAYGPFFTYHDQTDDFEFNDPFMRINRLRSLFDQGAALTDSPAFLSILNYKTQYKRLNAGNTLRRLQRLAMECMDIDTGCWTQRGFNFRGQWHGLKSWQRRMMAPVVDACRHMVDAFLTKPDPLDRPAVVLLHRPDFFCTPKRLTIWLNLMDRMLPNVQFVVSLPPGKYSRMPPQSIKRRLDLPKSPDSAPHKMPARVPKGTILLIQVDGRLPNLALMKLSHYYKSLGHKVILAHGSPYIKGVEVAYASCIFYSSGSDRHVKRLQKFYGDTLTIGGSGVDVGLRLPEKIESHQPDYDLYPELRDRALGFITRGCPNSCAFCIVPEKEGKPRIVSNLDNLLQKRKKLILLDDNILSHPDSEEILEEMAQRDLKVNFTQTLDIRMIDKYKARLLKRIHCSNTTFTRRVYHFSLNDNKNLDVIARKYKMLDFHDHDNVEFICMYGFNTTLAQDVERFRFLRTLSGAYVFVQKYRPIPGGPKANLRNFIDNRADALIDV